MHEKKFDELIDKLYEDTKKLREVVLSSEELSKQIFEFENSMTFYDCIHDLEKNDAQRYSALKKKLIEKENERFKFQLNCTKSGLVKGILNAKLKESNRKIDFSDEEVQMDAYSEVKSLLPFSDKILGYGHRRIFYSLGKIRVGEEDVWLGYKKIDGGWGHDVYYYEYAKTEVAREIEGLCDREVYCGIIMPRFYLIIKFNQLRGIGVVTQDLIEGGNKLPEFVDWQNMTFEDGKEYCFDAKDHGKYDEGTFDKGARIVNLMITEEELREKHKF